MNRRSKFSQRKHKRVDLGLLYGLGIVLLTSFLIILIL